ncbi:beta-lactamase family protein [Planctomycetota bacterium]|nr:beta-lactamase family protein [Planctomycetota bacterium]
MSLLFVGVASIRVGELHASDLLKSDERMEWVVIGPLPNELISEADRVGGVDGAGLDRDYLKALGGEADAVLKEGDVIKYVDAKGVGWDSTGIKVRVRQGAMVDFTSMMRPYDRRVGYAYCEFDSLSDEKAHVLFGSDDRAKVWLNGELVHQFRAYGRGAVLGDDKFEIDLRKGKNRLLVKVENGYGGWGFMLKMASEAEHAAMLAKMQERGQLERLMYTLMGRKSTMVGRQDTNGMRYMFSVGSFPELDFDNPELAEALLGNYEVDVRWFDNELNEVTRAAKPGRYGAVVHVEGESGKTVNRGYTFICYPNTYNWKRLLEDVDVGYFHNLGLSEKVWSDQQEWIDQAFYYGIRSYMFGHPDGVGLLGALYERDIELQESEDEQPEWLSPMVRNQDYLLALRMKASSREPIAKLAYPKRVVKQKAVVVREGTLAEAEFNAGFKEEMARVCQDWANESGIPFTVMVVRNGVIAYRGAHYKSGDDVVTERTQFPIASISKLMFSTVLSMLREQGMIELDEPIGKYIDGFPIEGEKAMTVRQCMMHLAGTDGHVNYGGMPNLWFDDCVRGMLPFTYPGEKYHYNGLSLNIVGRACELASGESFPRLMQTHLWEPLGCKDTLSVDTSTYTRTTAGDLAKVGQLLLNGGQYGDLYFFSQQTRDEMLPVKIGDVYDDTLSSNIVYGLACDWYRDVHKTNENGERELVFSDRMFGHGSATASIFRVDLDNNLVITMARPGAGKSYNKHYQKMFKLIGEYMK